MIRPVEASSVSREGSSRVTPTTQMRSQVDFYAFEANSWAFVVEVAVVRAAVVVGASGCLLPDARSLDFVTAGPSMAAVDDWTTAVKFPVFAMR